MLKKAAKNCAYLASLKEHFPSSFWDLWGSICLKKAFYLKGPHLIEMAIEKFLMAIEIEQENKSGKKEFLAQLFYSCGSAYDFLADFTQNTEDLEKAIFFLEEALLINPSLFYVHFNLGMAYNLLGQFLNDVECFDRAIYHFHKILEHDPEHELSWINWGLTLLYKAEALNDPALIQYIKKMHNDANEKFVRAASLGNRRAHYHIACVEAIKGSSIEKVIHHLERSRKMDGLPSFQDILEEKWLESVRLNPSFQEYISSL